ncbi:MAG: hypothetical protein AVDCRST_MAG56-1005 [uncultured Cytophagales bacterium]|uniref:DUF1735 domain-containing protein n=1 Tax=uncultured Cytophagales bacterium TaxID=158755 RepID=A0A6J4HSR9_9SPHI|nr:MAG: hypothetical protein AVDCRST_MAG56-1005 [uncultured Cytophagales bacterium]
MKIIKNLFLLLGLLAAGTACDDQFEDDLVRDNRPEVPVTFPGAMSVGFNPYYTASLKDTAEVTTGAAPTITIQMSIPENSGRSIQEISKIVVGGTAINAGTVSNPRIAAYAGPLPVVGTSATFTTPVRNFYLRAGRLSAADRQALGSVGYVERALMFLITLDDGSQIVPVQLRVRFTP